MAKKHKNSPPSRRKYELANPVVSCRVPREIYDRLQLLRKSAGVSMADVLKAGLSLYEPKVRAEKEIRQEGYDKGYDDGYEKATDSAWDLWAVTYPCRKCGKEMVVDAQEEKETIRKVIIASGWGHGDCNKA